MKSLLNTFPILACLIWLVGCGKSPTPPAAVETPVEAPVATTPAATNPATAGPPAAADGDSIKLSSRSGSKMRIEGTSNIHDWQVESSLIGGGIVAGPGFPLDTNATAPAGKVGISGEIFVTVRSLKSLKKDGTPYSDKMDEIMGEKLLVDKHPKILFRPTEVVPIANSSGTGSFKFTAAGDLIVAGASKPVHIPVTVLPLGDKKVKISGEVSLKMSDFKVEPPRPLGMFITTGDEVKILFEWMAAEKTP